MSYNFLQGGIDYSRIFNGNNTEIKVRKDDIVGFSPSGYFFNMGEGNNLKQIESGSTFSIIPVIGPSGSDQSIVIGYHDTNLNPGLGSLSIGRNSKALGDFSYAIGNASTANNINSVAIGNEALVRGDNSYAIGNRAVVNNNVNSYAIGSRVRVNRSATTAFGVNGNTTAAPSGYLFTSQPNIQLVRNGGTAIWLSTDSLRNGYIFCNGPSSKIGAVCFVSSNADYAELFEWLNDPIEDKYGYFVKLNGNKIIKADDNNGIIGITTNTAIIIGDSDLGHWKKRYKRNNLGSYIHRLSFFKPMLDYLHDRDFDIKSEKNTLDKCDMTKEDCIIYFSGIYSLNDEDIIELNNIEAIYSNVENEDYDPLINYIPRIERGWIEVGLMGKIHVHDDGNCIVGEMCSCLNGIAIPGDKWHVLERISENTIEILFK